MGGGDPKRLRVDLAHDRTVAPALQLPSGLLASLILPEHATAAVGHAGEWVVGERYTNWYSSRAPTVDSLFLFYARVMACVSVRGEGAGTMCDRSCHCRLHRGCDMCTSHSTNSLPLQRFKPPKFLRKSRATSSS